MGSSLPEFLDPVTKPQVFPAEESDGDVPVDRDVVVDRPKVEILPLYHARIADKLEDLQLSDLVRDPLSWSRRKERRFAAGSLPVHRDHRRKVLRRPVDRKVPGCEPDVRRNPERPEPHETV